ncbi:uncharacterized protein [Anoplolepis gracilipes]|uniref:uncharacterized protein n=1 Tax=Anoplolepis gracilipes TaxID=354296 RepID=UPI003B9F36A8
MWKAVVLCTFLGLAVAQRATFNNYKVFRIIPTTEPQVKILRELEDLVLNGFSFWESPSFVGRNVDLMVAPHKLPEFHEMMSQIGISYQIYIEDVQALIDVTTPLKRSTSFDFTSYHPLDEIYKNLDDLAKQYAQVKTIEGGKTYEGRLIKGVKVSFKPNNTGIFLEGGIHAREWISPATVMYLLHQLLTSNNTDVRSLAEKYDWYIFPSFNPDGYVYTHTTNRMWRKTRKPYGNCYGSDPNRNWDYRWNTGGASNNSCSETYAGNAPFSEIETKSMSQFIESIKDKFDLYISFHSYSQLLMFPYGHTKTHLENYDDEYAIGSKAIEALKQRYGTEYVTGNIAETIYVATGSTCDYIKGVYHKPYSFTYELRDQGRYGFLLPPNQIIPTGEETTDSVIALIKEAEKRGFSNKKQHRRHSVRNLLCLTYTNGHSVTLYRLYRLLENPIYFDFVLVSPVFFGYTIIMSKIIILCIVLGLVVAQKVTYDNYKVFRIIPTTQQQVHVLRQLEDVLCDYSFWKPPTTILKAVDVMVPPHKLDEFYYMAAKIKIPFLRFIENVQTLIDRTMAQQTATFDFLNYHTLDEIYKNLDALAKKFPNKVKIITAGSTYEGRYIKGVKVSFKVLNPGVFIEGGIHGREWISPATVMYILHQLLISKNADVRALAESYDWYIFPVFNPDGYVYTHITNRLWKKTLKPYSIFCNGSDLNRNWNYRWNEEGASNNPCSDAYAGSEPFSDREAATMSEFIYSIRDKFDAYISFHSYRQLLMFPYGDSQDLRKEQHKNEYIMGTEAVAALKKRYGTEYITGSIARTIHVATGSTSDYVKSLHGKPFVFTYELRDRGHGFLLPPDQIIPTGEETLDSLIALFKEAKNLKFDLFYLPLSYEAVATRHLVYIHNIIIYNIYIICNIKLYILYI